MPVSYARITACTRSRSPSLASRLPTCVLTVASLMNRAAAISVLLPPLARSTSTSRSRAVSEASRAGEGEVSGGLRANASMRRRVTDGASRAWPAAAARMLARLARPDPRSPLGPGVQPGQQPAYPMGS